MTAVDDVSKDLQQRLRAGDRVLLVIAGPNGAGKSTFIDTFLQPTGLRFINPDQIAQALAPDDPSAMAYEAARAADSIRGDLVARGVSFAMETVFSDPQGAKLGLLRHAQSQGYAVLLVFIGLESEDLAVARVMERVEAGGHDVADEKIRSRFARTFANLTRALEFLDHAFLFDNSSADAPFRFVAELASGSLVKRGPRPPQWARSILRTLPRKGR